MKRLIFIGGAMGVGKTATARALQNRLQPAAMLDGDWSWDIRPFTVNDGTKETVQQNITFLLRQFFMGIPTELEESIRIDGGGAYRCFWHIVLPLSKTALITFGTFVFQFAWNNYLWPLLVTNSLEKYVLPMGINFFTGQFTTYYQYMMAAATMAMLPMIVVYLFAQRYFVAGISLSGIKA